MTARRAHAANAEQQLAAARRYLEALDAASSLLTDPSAESVERVLAALGHACDARLVALYRNPAGTLVARRVGFWTHTRAGLVQSVLDALGEIDFTQYRALRDTLVAGVMLIRRVKELPPAQQLLLGQLGGEHLMCVPLLDGGELVGFIAALSDVSPRQRPPLEARLLSTLTHYLGLLLVRQESVDKLRASEQRLKALVGATEDMVFEFDPDGRVIHQWSHHPAIPRVALAGLPLERAFPPDMAWALRRAIPVVLGGAGAEEIEFTVPRLEGVLYFTGRLEAVPSGDGQCQHVVALVREVTDALREDAQRRVMVETLDLLEEAVMDIALDGRILHASPAWSRLRGERERVANADDGHNLLDHVHPDERAPLAAALQGVVASNKPVVQRFRLMREQDDPLWLEAKLIANVGLDGRVVSLRGVLRDVTVAHLNERHIMKLALYDALTGLPNRVLLDDLLHQAIARARRNGTKAALGFIDLDHFKQINDAFGHAAGDAALVTIARQLKSVLREEDTLARWGGDEFVVLIPDLDDLGALGAIAERLREIARQGVVIDGVETRPTISIGLAVFPDNAQSGEDLMSAADSTMYYAKAAGRNNVQFYGDIMHLKTLGREHMAIQTRLNHAVLQNELQVFFQPIVQARTGEVSSIEALVRWQDDTSGWVSPTVFVPMAERLGLIEELSEQVMVQALMRLKAWRERGLQQRLALNLSRNLLFSPRFAQTLIDLVRQQGLRPADVTLEVTESLALTDYSRQSRHLRELHRAGFAIAIDDFGTGYSSLSQLHDMPIDLIKVDISFTSRLNTESGRRVMQAIVQMAQALGLEVVVEGVENLETARFLQGLGVEKMQGHYFSEAVPAGICELMMQLGMQSKL